VNFPFLKLYPIYFSDAGFIIFYPVSDLSGESPVNTLKPELTFESNLNQVILYQSEDGQTSLVVQLQEDTVWLNLLQLAELFQRDKSVISRHIKNIFTEQELHRRSTVAKFATVQSEGQRKVGRKIEFYNLDVIISVGYRVKSKRGTQFRIWANRVIKDYLVKGFALNEKRLTDTKNRLDEVSANLRLMGRIIRENIYPGLSNSLINS